MTAKPDHRDAALLVQLVQLAQWHTSCDLPADLSWLWSDRFLCDYDDSNATEAPTKEQRHDPNYPEQNKANAHRIYEELFSQGNEAVVDELFSPDYVDTSPNFPPGLPRTGLEGIKVPIAALRRAFPDLKVTINDIVAEGDTIVIRATWTGKYKGPCPGIDMPPTGKRVGWSGMDWATVKDGMCVSHMGIDDTLGLLQQMGVIPAPEAQPAG